MPSHSSFLLIGALAAQANTTKDTVRHYYEMGLLKSRKCQAGSRLYTEFYPECVERIEMIKSAQAIGFSLNEFKEFLNDYYEGTIDVDKQLSVITQKLSETKRQQNNIINIINQLDAHHKVLKDIKMKNTGRLSKVEWEKRLAEQLLKNNKYELVLVSS